MGKWTRDDLILFDVTIRGSSKNPVIHYIERERGFEYEATCTRQVYADYTDYECENLLLERTTWVVAE